jgi:hypothetical protein
MKLLDVCKTHLQNLEDADDKENVIFHEFMYKMLLSGVLEKSIMK